MTGFNFLGGGSTTIFGGGSTKTIISDVAAEAFDDGILSSMADSISEGITSAEATIIDIRLTESGIAEIGESAAESARPELPREESVVIERALENRRELRARELGSPPIPPEELEEQGPPDSFALRTEEKPKILAIIEEKLPSINVPSQLTLVVKKLKSNRFRVVSYKIFKKSVFTDSRYTEIANLESISATINPKYVAIAREAGLTITDIFTFSDRLIEPGRIYSYKVRLDYDTDTEREDAVTDPPAVAAIREVEREIIEEGANSIGGEVGVPRARISGIGGTGGGGRTF